MKQANKWTVNNVITTVLMCVLIIVIQLVVSMICMMNEFVSMVLSTGFSMLLCAPVYFLLVQKVSKRGVSLVLMTMMGIIYLLIGNWYLLPYLMVVGLILELILWKNGATKNPRRLTVAWLTASLLHNGINLLPIWFFWDVWYKFASESGMSTAYINTYKYYFSNGGWLLFIVLFTTLCGYIGSLFGSALIKKHFEKAGIL